MGKASAALQPSAGAWRSSASGSAQGLRGARAPGYLQMTNSSRSPSLVLGHFDLVGQEGQFAGFQDGLLGELFDVVGRGPTAQDQSLTTQFQVEVAHPVVGPGADQRLQMMRVAAEIESR